MPLMFLSKPCEMQENLKTLASTLIESLENSVKLAKDKKEKIVNRLKMAENCIKNLEEIISVVSKYRDDDNCDIHPQKIGSVFVAVGNSFLKMDTSEAATSTGSVAECYEVDGEANAD